jgi:dipeptidyl aminopeptidase/acylaminoacyl peptidase
VSRDRRYWLRLAKLTALALLLGVGAGVGGYGLWASAAYTHALTHPGCHGPGLTPADVGLEAARDVSYLSHDGLTLRAWYLPPRNGRVIVLLPGAGGARDGLMREGAVLARHGYGLLMTELRSCAHPEGQSTLGHAEAHDLSQAVTWLQAQPEVEAVGALGFSLGGVTAILGAAEDERIEAVVAQGGFYDLAADIKNQGYSSTPGERIIHHAILHFFRRETGVDAHAISPIAVVHHLSPRPLLLIYGEREVVETRPHHQLARAGEPKSLWIVPDCSHGGYLDAAPGAWERRVVSFFDGAWDRP